MRPHAARWLPLVLVAAAGVPVAAAGCRGAAVEHGDARARAHVEMLAGTIGSRPVGSRAAARAREYLVDELRRAGFVVRMQPADSVDERRGLTVPVVNIIATRGSALDEAIALIAHYDSIPDASGALDDALGVAVCLESARSLAESGLRHSLMVILTDGEELGLMGARAAVTDREVAGRVRAFLNFDGTGGAGPALLFEAGPGYGDGLRAWTGAAAPEGGSFSTEIYRRLPNDTDFTIFKTLGAAGLNFAAVGDSYAYHTDRDVPSRVQPFTLRHAIANTVSTVRRIDATGLATASDAPTWFDIGGLRGAAYGRRAAVIVAWTACVLAALVWLRLTREVWRARRIRGIVLTPIWAIAGVAVGVAAMVGAAWGLRAVRAELNPWYGSPHWFFLCSAASGALGFGLVARLGTRVAAEAGPFRHPTATWWLALPIWIVLAATLQVTAPTASYLVSIPLLVASVLIAAAGARAARLRAVSATVFIVCWLFWIGDALRMLEFMVPLFGWLPVVPPVWVYAALMTLCATLCAPPLAAVLAGRTSRWAAPFLWALAAVGVATGVLAFRSPAYTAERPERRAVRYVQDDVQQRAWWEIAGPEPTLALAADRPMAGEWQRVSDSPPGTVGVPSLRAAFAFRAPAAALATPLPAAVRARVAPTADGHLELTVTIVPREYLAATLILPEGVVPISSTIAGSVSAGRWRATYVAPAPVGLDIRVIVDADAADALSNAVAMLGTFSVPGAEAGSRLPGWLPQERATWQARSLYLVRAGPERAP